MADMFGRERLQTMGIVLLEALIGVIIIGTLMWIAKFVTAEALTLLPMMIVVFIAMVMSAVIVRSWLAAGSVPKGADLLQQVGAVLLLLAIPIFWQGFAGQIFAVAQGQKAEVSTTAFSNIWATWGWPVLLGGVVFIVAYTLYTYAKK